MADLNVQPKKKKSIIPWLLLALGVIALIAFLSRRDDGGDLAAGTTNDSSSIGAAGQRIEKTEDDSWGNVDLTGPAQSYEEIDNKNINVRGTKEYAVYDLGEDVLFAEGKSEILDKAVPNLEQVCASIKKRFDQGAVRLYGFTDAQGDQQSNLHLSQARAEAVRQWLISKGNIAESRISINALGESNPKASNSTESGRKENRRVQIVAKADS